jgi:hypothetical protein
MRKRMRNPAVGAGRVSPAESFINRPPTLKATAASTRKMMSIGIEYRANSLLQLFANRNRCPLQTGRAFLKLAS